MKVLCPKCGNLIDADPNKEDVFCNDCGATFKYVQGKQMIDNEYRALQTQGFNLIYKKNNYEKGYEVYKSCLEYRQNDLSSIIGMVLAKLYGQSFDKLEFENAISLIESYDIALDKENTFLFLSFIFDCFKQIHIFFNESNSRLMKDGIFYSKEYFSYFTEGVKEIEKLLEYFNTSFSLMDEEEVKIFKDSEPTFDREFTNFQKMVEDIKKSTYKVNGLGEVDFNGEVIHSENYDITPITQTDLHLIIQVKEVNKTAYKMIAILVVLAVSAIVLLTVGLVIKNNIILYCGFIPVFLAVIISLVFSKKITKKL